MNSALRMSDYLGHRLVDVFRYAASITNLVTESISSAWTDKKHQSFSEILRVVAAQIYFTGFQALPIISVLALVAGSLIVIQASSQLSKVGGGEMLGNLLVILIVRELGPLITALVVVARSGTAVAAELGTRTAGNSSG